MSVLRGRNRLRFHRPVDLVAAAAGGLLVLPVIAIATIAAGFASRASGLFRQTRVGRDGTPFTMYKIRTMRNGAGPESTVTTADDQRITGVGRVIRRYKLDEFPQLLNVLRGEMALIGPRPDVPGFADRLVGESRAILGVRPGLSGPASLLFRDEELLLSRAGDPDSFNDQIVYPIKTRVNRAWLNEASIADDIRLLAWTITRPDVRVIEDLIEKWDPGFGASQDYACVRTMMGR